MEDGGKGTQGISTRRPDLAHHIHQNGTRLTDSHLDVGTLIVGTQMAANLALGCRYRKTCHMHWAIIGHSHLTIGRDRQLHALLGVTIHIDNQLVARSQHIVLGRGDVHDRLKGQIPVVEDVTTKDPSPRRSCCSLLHIDRGILTSVSLQTIVAHLIVDTHTVLRRGYGIISGAAHTTLIQLFAVLTTQTLDLLHGRSTLKELHGNIGL